MNRLLSLALLLAAACGERESARTPQTSAAPEVVVAASSGPIRLSLSLWKMSARKSEGIHYKVELRNISRNPIVVDDPAFGDGLSVLRREGGTFVEVLDQDGRIVDFTLLRNEAAPESARPADPDTQARARAWRKQGLNDGGIAERLSTYSSQAQRELDKHELSKRRHPLNPGEAVAAAQWRETAATAQSPRAGAPVDYSEMPKLYLDQGARYRIRAVYRHAPSQWMIDFHAKHHGGSMPPEAVTVYTPYADFTVLGK